MSQLWAACAEAGPLAALPQGRIQGIAQRFHAFYRAFRCFRRVLRHQHTTLESYHEYQQTWDECNDFLHHNPVFCLQDTLPQTNLLHENACYVYNSSDLDLLERRLDLQLHIMNAKLDDIILNLFLVVLRQSDMHRMPQVISTEAAPQYEVTLPSALTPVEKNTWPLFRHLIELREALKRTRAPPLSSVHCEKLWILVVARFRDHELPFQGSQLMFSRDFKLSDRKRLREYSQQTLKQRQSSYRTQKPSPYLRRRVYTHDNDGPLATLQPHSLEEEEILHSVDIVTYLGNRCIVSTRIDEEWGFVQHLPPISEIHPYTKHERFRAPQIRLYDACNVEEVDGAELWRHKGRKPSYSFDSKFDAIAFQCALRGKVLMHTFQVEDITSERGSESTAQPLKLWSDLDGRNQSISFLVQKSKPYYHIDVPLRLFANSIHTSDAGMKIRTGLLRRFSDLLRHSPPDTEQAITRRDSRQEITDTFAEDNLPTQDTQFLLSLSHLRFEFSSLEDGRLFQEALEGFFSETRETEPSSGQPISISRENSEGPRSPSTVVVPEPNPHPQVPPRRQSLNNHLDPPNLDDALPPGILHGESNGAHGHNTESAPLLENPPSPQFTKDLDYRVRGIRLEYAVPDLLTYLGRKLGIEPTVVGRVKALATSQTGDKVAVVAWRPQPACLSTPGKDEWDFGPTSDDDDLHITVDTHFRGVSILYSPPPDVPHTIDICAIAGLGGHAWGSFKYKGVSQSFMWVLDGLRDRLRNARLMTYGSKTRLDGNESSQTLEDLGKLLRDEMRSVTKRRAQSVLSSTSSHLGTAFAVPSYFIAHSLGGLTVKEALLQEKKNPEPGTFISNLQGALFFGVPSHGMHVEVLEGMIRGQPNEFLVKSIMYESPTLQDLSRRFKSEFEGKKPKIIYFYEMEPSFSPEKNANGQWKMTGKPKKMLVDRGSATDGEVWGAGHVNTHPLNRNHSDLVKFSSPNDADFLRVLTELKELVGYVEIGED
ncbi:hypothetical protein PEBR_24007 [Penicillium brasilianum]|uniref:DUF676 domain-containing protein n=1 Tax=Penicillium brasilianum TaxID=104259 RepID=A0A1S9RKK9_PENBI|nr:hypothetical protein PEBR_24007 [Penicillium brasilianum]